MKNGTGSFFSKERGTERIPEIRGTTKALMKIQFSPSHFPKNTRDELETNLKKILHRNGMWGLEDIVM